MRIEGFFCNDGSIVASLCLKKEKKKLLEAERHTILVATKHNHPS